MIRLTVLLGILLIIIAFAGYFLSNMASLTSLIPLIFGIPLLALANMAKKPDKRQIAIYLAMFVAFLGTLGTYAGVYTLYQSYTLDHATTIGQYMRTIMFILCVIYIIIGIFDFLAQRKKR